MLKWKKILWVVFVISGTVFSNTLYNDPARPLETRVEDLLSRLTLEEKVHLCHGQGSFLAGKIDRLGIKGILMCDGPHGARTNVANTYLPTGIALASSWNPDLAFDYAAVLGREVKASNHRVLLGPGVNIMRTPLCGRNFEYYGEDPYLAGQIAVGYVRGIQSEDVAACVKHLACNNQEYWRTTNSSEVDERTLREIYLPAFRMACRQGGTWMMMSAYNKVNGTYASANKLLQYDIPKTEWGWDGVVVSDWGAVHSTMGPALGGLDLQMPANADSLMGTPLLKAVKEGKVSEAVIDDKARRMIRLMLRTRVLDTLENARHNSPDHQAVARRAACEGSVLLKNENDFLPLDRNAVRTLAVIGPSADKQHAMGGVRGSGGSSAVTPPYEITPLAGLKEKLGDDIRIVYVQGTSFQNDFELIPSANLTPGKIQDGLTYNQWPDKQFAGGETVIQGTPHGLYAEYFANLTFSGTPAYVCVDRQVMFDWKKERPNPKLPADGYSVRWTGYLTVEKSGSYELAIASDDGSRLYLDDELIVDQWRDQSLTTGSATVQLKAGCDHKIKMEYYERAGGAVAKLLWKKADAVNFTEAVAAAKSADAVLVFGGTDHTYDKEALGWGHVPNADKPDLELIGPQAELINAVAAANPNTAVVLIAGAPVSVEQWHDNVRAIMDCWYPGQEGGRAIADMLFGDAYPSGKLCCTFGKKLTDYPCHANGSYPGTGNKGTVTYEEGIFVGYRYFDREKIEPRYPFGFGLSYTTFKYSGLKLTQVDDQTLRVSFEIKNTGKRTGDEIAQVYVSDQKASLPRPEKELKGFRKVHLLPGQTKTVSLTLDKMAFSFFDPTTRKWTAEPGDFKIWVGSSSRDIYLREHYTLK